MKKELLQSNLIFLHIPKNGGTTLHSIINRKYPPKTIFSIEEINNQSNITDFMVQSEKDRKRIKVIKGHLQFGLHEYMIGSSKYISFLRKPEDRILSYYNHIKRLPNHRMYNTIVGKKMSFYEFVRDINHDDIHNTQVQWISGIKGNDHNLMVAKAKENIENYFSFVGLLERYDQSLILLSDLYNWGIPYYQLRNKGSYPNEQQLDDKSVEIIKEKNIGDEQLYTFIKNRLNKQINADHLLKLKLSILSMANRAYSNKTIRKIKRKLL